MDFSNVLNFIFGQVKQKCDPVILVGNVPSSKHESILELLEGHCRLQPKSLKMLEFFERPNKSISMTIHCGNESILSLVLEETCRRPVKIDGEILSVGPLFRPMSDPDSSEENELDTFLVPGCEFDMEFPKLTLCNQVSREYREGSDSHVFPSYRDCRQKAIRDIEETNREMIDIMTAKRKSLAKIQSEVHSNEVARVQLLKKQGEIEEKIACVDQSLAELRDRASIDLAALENLKLLHKEKIKLITDEISILRRKHGLSSDEKSSKVEELEEKIKDFAECSCCFENFNSSVFQCVRGHLICPNCHDKLDLCPQCRVKFERPGIRCLMAEQLLGFTNT